MKNVIKQSRKNNVKRTYSNQSTAMIRVMSSAGRPTTSSTITMVTKPACGIPAAPIAAAVAVILLRKHRSTEIIYITFS